MTLSTPRLRRQHCLRLHNGEGGLARVPISTPTYVEIPSAAGAETMRKCRWVDIEQMESFRSKGSKETPNHRTGRAAHMAPAGEVRNEDILVEVNLGRLRISQPSGPPSASWYGGCGDQ